MDTPGVEKSLPGFHKAMGSNLRTVEQGIDTILWAALSPEVEALPNGSFLFGNLFKVKLLLINW